MLTALRRLGVADKVVRVVEAMYKDPHFTVRIDLKNPHGDGRELGSGRSAPCHLFACLLSRTFEDIHDEVGYKVAVNQFHASCGSEMRHYADDTTSN